MAHGQYLGTGKTLNGSALVVLCETGLWGNLGGPGKYDEKLQAALQEAHADFLAWKRAANSLVANLALQLPG